LTPFVSGFADYRERKLSRAGMAGIVRSEEDSGGELDLLSFPCAIEIKAIGLHSNRLVAVVESIVARHVPAENRLSVFTRLSSKGKYLSVTCRIRAQSRKQLDVIYQELSASSEVVMAL
jgi:putative lipoic acid-binding regulatory protein